MGKEAERLKGKHVTYTYSQAKNARELLILIITTSAYKLIYNTFLKTEFTVL